VVRIHGSGRRFLTGFLILPILGKKRCWGGFFNVPLRGLRIGQKKRRQKKGFLEVFTKIIF